MRPRTDNHDDFFAMMPDSEAKSADLETFKRSAPRLDIGITSERTPSHYVPVVSKRTASPARDICALACGIL